MPLRTPLSHASYFPWLNLGSSPDSSTHIPWFVPEQPALSGVLTLKYSVTSNLSSGLVASTYVLSHLANPHIYVNYKDS